MPRILLAVLFAQLSAVAVSGADIGDWWREGQTSPWSFGVLDGDGDGRVSAAEATLAQRQFAAALKETKASLLAAIDVDHNGKLTHYEAAEGMPRWVSLRARAQALAVVASDQDRDGKLSDEESSGLEHRIGTVFMHHGIAAVDANQDKSVSRPEIQAAIRAIRDGTGRLFTLCDRNSDGQVSEQEANLAFDILAAASGAF